MPDELAKAAMFQFRYLNSVRVDVVEDLCVAKRSRWNAWRLRFWLAGFLDGSGSKVLRWVNDDAARVDLLRVRLVLLFGLSQSRSSVRKRLRVLAKWVVLEKSRSSCEVVQRKQRYYKVTVSAKKLTDASVRADAKKW